MNKFIHLLTDPNLPPPDVSTWQELKGKGAKDLVIMQVDGDVTPASSLRMEGTGPVPTATISYHAKQALLPDGITYQVEEHRPLPRVHQTGRLPGFTQVTILHRKRGLTDRDFHDIWLTDHRTVAIETQSNYYYHQYAHPIPLNGAPQIDGIVEEGFPDGAMTDPSIFFDGVDDPTRFETNRARMMKSVFRFLDLQAITVIPMSAYCL